MDITENIERNRQATARLRLQYAGPPLTFERPDASQPVPAGVTWTFPERQAAWLAGYDSGLERARLLASYQGHPHPHPETGAAVICPVVNPEWNNSTPPLPTTDQPDLATLDQGWLESIAVNLLSAIGEDPEREGLRDTPRRFASWWREFIDYAPGAMETAFEAVSVDQMVVVGPMRVWSLCEHHLLPFFADITVAYIPAGEVMGLSKLARICHHHAHRLQLQERLVSDIAGHIGEVAVTPDVAVVAQGEHLCMTMRGIRTPAVMTTSDLRGRFRDDPRARAEFLAFVSKR